jgi:hypothetical protein
MIVMIEEGGSSQGMPLSIMVAGPDLAGKRYGAY